MYLIISILALVFFAFLVWASADISNPFYLKSFCRGGKNRPLVAITFDDGPDSEMTPRILEVLRKHSAKATFFLIGEKCEKFPEIVQKIVADGHLIGNHTYSHTAKYTLWNTKKVVAEIEKCQTAIEKITGQKTPYFRPPFGVKNPHIGQAVAKLGLISVGWSIRSLDTISCNSREKVCKNVVKKLHNGAVILLHDRCLDADVLLEMLLIEIEKNGYNTATIAELMNNQNLGKI